MKHLFLIVFFNVCTVVLFSQNSNESVLSYDDYIQIVMEHHPRVYQADIRLESAEAGVLKARGGFDPKLHGDVNQKYFGDKQYYSTIVAGMKVPTWFGITAQAGYEANNGEYLNPQFRVPDAGLWYAGLQVELGNGLIIDDRRAELKKAKLYQETGALERKVILNELSYQASIAYWEWQRCYRQMLVYDNALRNAEIRLKGVKEAVLFGDRPAIDTVEAGIQMQSRSISFNNTRLKLMNAQVKLEMFLWKDGYVPLEIEGLIPQKETILNNVLSSLAFERDSLIENHPFLKMNELKIAQSQIDLTLKKESLKPKMTLKYNAIAEPVGNNVFAEYSPSNYTWGGSLAYPILTRKERADVKLSKLKMEDLNLSQYQKILEVKNKIEMTSNRLTISMEQLDLFTKTASDYKTLYNAERSLFDIGESSLFMINSREKSMLEAEIQLIEVESEILQLNHELSFQLMAN